MAVWFSPNHRTKFLSIGTNFRNIFRVEYGDCFMAEFIVVNDSLEMCKIKK